MNYRKAGFTQRRPREPGVYFVAAPSLDHDPLWREGWNVAEVDYIPSAYTCLFGDLQERPSWWRIRTAQMEYAWKPGMWTKGPISPTT